ncbi:hypothetical protein SLA2020_473090 [Shorea laevis]
MRLLSSSVGAANGELMKNQLELSFAALNLTVELADDAVATANRVVGAGVGLEHDGAHGDFLVRKVEVLDDLGDVAYAKQFMGVKELPLAVVRKIRGENAVMGALPALVFTRCASLRRGCSNSRSVGHGLELEGGERSGAVPAGMR